MNQTPTFFKKPITCLYQDTECMVFNKPAGILVIPIHKDENNTLTDIVNFQFAQDQSWGRLHPCHRLDRETSGVILYAKGKKNQQILMQLFHERTIAKNYIAFLQGRLNNQSGELKGQIQDLDSLKFRRNSSGNFAVTRYKVLELKGLFTVVDVEPITGRTNQIRIQFAKIGFPLIGDRKYSVARDYPLKFRRTALHAASLEWISPFTKNKIVVQSNLPEDMEVFLERNRD